MAEAGPNPPSRLRPDFAGPPLTAPQQRVLAALVALCPDSGCDVGAREVADAAELRLGSVVVVLQSLEKKKLALMHRGEGDEADGWAPTLTGRSRVRHFRAGAAGRPAPGEPPAAGR